jgi:hypothetical protein
MTHRCHAKIVVLLALTQTKVAVRVSRDPFSESVTKDGEPIEMAHTRNTNDWVKRLCPLVRGR